MKNIKIPSHLEIGREVWEIRWVAKFKDRHQVGESDPEKRIIKIRKGMTTKETWATLIHEVLHAVDAEYDIKLKHKKIYALDRAFSEFIVDNFI